MMDGVSLPAACQYGYQLRDFLSALARAARI
jgi:hypothetical protein